MNSLKSHSIATNLDKNSIEISFKELAVLKCQAYGCSKTEIFKLLELDNNQYHILLQSMYSKFQTNNMFETIKIALFTHVLNRYDIVKDEVKVMALKYSKSLYGSLSILSENEKNNYPIEQILTQFITNINTLYISKATEKDSLPLKKQEIDCVKTRLKNFKLNIDSDSQSLKQTANELANQFNTNNFFNTARRIFELNLIEKHTIVEDFKYVDSEIRVAISEKMASIFSINKYSDSEKELCLYFDLIKYYNKIEDLLLFG